MIGESVSGTPGTKDSPCLSRKTARATEKMKPELINRLTTLVSHCDGLGGLENGTYRPPGPQSVWVCSSDVGGAVVVGRLCSYQTEPILVLAAAVRGVIPSTAERE